MSGITYSDISGYLVIGISLITYSGPVVKKGRNLDILPVKKEAKLLGSEEQES